MSIRTFIPKISTRQLSKTKPSNSAQSLTSCWDYRVSNPINRLQVHIINQVMQTKHIKTTRVIIISSSILAIFNRLFINKMDSTEKRSPLKLVLMGIELLIINFTINLILIIIKKIVWINNKVLKIIVVTHVIRSLAWKKEKEKKME
jgi:hypothetical protein